MISFKQFLSEKAMNASEFSKTEARQGENALVGFEFECIVPEESRILANREINRDWVALNRITDFNELSEYFDIDRKARTSLQREYNDWVETKGEDDDIEWENFVDDEYGSVYKFVKTNDLDPTYGWEADTGQASARVYIEGLNSEDSEGMEKETFANIENDLSNYLNANVTTAWRGAEEHYARGDWIVVPDRSISPNGFGIGAEINSPPQKLSKALKDLNTMFKWMSANGIETNGSTGLHINISMPGIQEADLVKLVLFMGDKFVLKQFNRLNNEYTRSQAQNILNNVSGNGKLPREASAMIKIARSALSNEKYSSVHIEKLKHGYLEFRIAGGAGYHLKHDLIRDTVLRFVTALELACDPNAERQQYLKKLTKIMDIAEEGDMNRDLETRPIVDILDLAGNEDTSKMLDNLLKEAKAGKLDTPSGRDRASKWFKTVFLKDLFRSLLELGIKTTSSRQQAEFKVIAKRLFVDPSFFTSPADPWAIDVLQKFGARK